MNTHQVRPSTLAVSVCTLLLQWPLLPLARAAAEPAPSPLLSEILVTARKKEESLSRVPLSLSVIDAERMSAANINKIAELTEFAPNLSMTETGVSTQMYIRGIGSGNNQGFEQSVGQYVDGIYYGRQQLIRSPFLDLQRVEVLRGPQSILFGKNSIAGALNLSTARPTESFEGHLHTLYELKAGQREFSGMLSGPLSADVRARLAYRHLRERGYLHNSLLDRNEVRRDEDALRLSLEWDLNDSLQAALKLERNAFEGLGRQIEIIRDEANLNPAGSDPLAGLNFSQILQVLDEPHADTRQDFRRQVDADEFSRTAVSNATLKLAYAGDRHLLHVVTGLLHYDFSERCDCDYSPASIFAINLHEKFTQFSQEVRLDSSGISPVEWTAGVYYQHTDMDSDEGLEIPENSLLTKLAIRAAEPQMRALALLGGSAALRINRQRSQAWALFARLTWSLSDRLRLVLGSRYTREHKNAFRSVDILDTETGTAAPGSLLPRIYLEAFGIHSRQLMGLTLPSGITLQGHHLLGTRNENSMTPQLGFEWESNANTLLYLTATTGFKAGGFDARANNPFSFEFSGERSTAFELGTKKRFADKSLEINLALFHTHYKKLQVSQFDGRLGFNVGNAADTRVRGLEVDGRWAISDHLDLAYAWAWLDFEFIDFSNGNCYNRQPPDGALVNGVALCDFSGARGQYTPRHKASLVFDYSRPTAAQVEIFSSLMLNYTGRQNIHDNLDPNFLIGNSVRINLRAGLRSRHWTLAVMGKNISNEKILTYAGNVPMTAPVFGTNTYYAVIDRPRQLALELDFSF
ncbi:MAG: TonB-dependent receptor [Pseudomonadales bacterium]|nr:TonB-dependent receptor [Pseudomonadales bacterium]